MQGLHLVSHAMQLRFDWISYAKFENQKLADIPCYYLFWVVCSKRECLPNQNEEKQRSLSRILTEDATMDKRYVWNMSLYYTHERAKHALCIHLYFIMLHETKTSVPSKCDSHITIFWIFKRSTSFNCLPNTLPFHLIQLQLSFHVWFLIRQTEFRSSVTFCAKYFRAEKVWRYRNYLICFKHNKCLIWTDRGLFLHI